MKTSFLPILFLLFLSACQEPEHHAPHDCLPAPDDLGNSHPQAATLQTFLDGQVAKGLPGAIMLVKNHKGLWIGASGKADLKHNTDMQKCHVSRIASITKNFTAATILLLAEEGKLSLDDTVATYLSADLADKIDNTRKATIRQLMNHTSGIRDYDVMTEYNLDALNKPGKFWTHQESLNYIFNKKAHFSPGEKIEYSNTAYILLGLIIEKVTGKQAQQVMKEKIFAPLHMDNTIFPAGYALTPELIRGYDNRHGEGHLVDMTDFKLGYYTEGGIITSAYDLYLYINALYKGNLLTEKSLKEMTSFVPDPKPYQGQTGIGLGIYQWETNFGKAWSNAGGQYGYRAFMAYFPEKDVTYILLTNCSMVQQDQLFEETNRKVLEIIGA